MTKIEEHSEPWVDSIVSEVREARESLFAESGYNLDKLAERLRREQAGSGRRIVTRQPRRPAQGSGEAA